MAAAPCIECRRRPKALPRQRCETCLLRHEPIGVQVEAARVRLAMIPPEMRAKRTKAMQASAPSGTAWCAGCQSYRDDVDFRSTSKGVQTQCYACRSARAHAAMVKKVYGLGGGQYEALLELQSGGCAVCGAKSKSKRLAVDHDHKTGAVRGLLCKRHNKDALGALHDSIAQVTALWHYLNTPPASGSWTPIAQQGQLVPTDGRAQRAAERLEILQALVGPNGKPLAPAATERAVASEIDGLRVLPIGSQRVPGKRGIWKVYVEPDSDVPF